MKKLLVLIPFLLFLCTGIAQSTPGETYPGAAQEPDIVSRLHIKQDHRMEQLVRLHIKRNQQGGKIQGFRVEIFFSSDMNARQNAQHIKNEFLNAYPGTNVYITYVSPDFKVRVGDFRTRNEAIKLMKEIQNQFPKAFVVPDIIELPKLF